MSIYEKVLVIDGIRSKKLTQVVYGVALEFVFPTFSNLGYNL